MPKVSRRTKVLTLAGSVTAAVAIVAVDVLVISRSEPSLFNDFFIFAYLIAIAPPMVADYLDRRWKASVDRHLPSLLRNVAMGQMAGKNLPRALEDASKARDTALSVEMRKALRKIKMGSDFHKTIEELGTSLGTKLSKETMRLIVISDKFGGATQEVFDRAADYVESMLMYRDERRAKVNPYVATFYVSVVIFIGLTIILLQALIPTFLELRGTQFLGRGGYVGATSLDYYRDNFLLGAVIVSSFAGLTCGQIREGSLSAGVIHIALLVLMSYLTYLFIAGT